jgi:serine/threonine protein kinase
MTATHPTDRELEDFLLGKLIAPDDLAVESHLAECHECRDRAVQTPADDTLTELLAAARTLVDVQRSAAPTPRPDGSATPPAFAPTLAWDGSAAAGNESKAPPALANHPKYRVVRRLGAGGMGTVWLAEHLVMNRPVAVKVIRPDLLARPGATNRFLREVRAAAKLHHPNIVTAFDAEPVGDSCLLVMEYVPGQTLGERLEVGPLPVGEACQAIRDAARGLAHAHAAGLVHRDVKPHNLIRAADGTTKVLDFGLAGVGAGEVIPASGDGLTGAGMVVGTPDYIAPEQINNPHAADARADIYGLGCTLYHLLAGRPPLPDGSVAEKLAIQPTHQPDPIPGLPPGLADVLAKMMAKRPEDRYRSAAELLSALEPYSGPLTPRAEPTRGASGPHWRRWLALAAGILLVTAGAVIFKIERDNQIVQVEVNDPDIEVVMKRNGEIVLIRDAKTKQTWEYDTLKHQIGMVDQPDGLKLEVSGKEPFTLRRKGERVFTVSRQSSPWANMPDFTRAAKMEDATRAAEAWLKLYDTGDFARAWEESSTATHRKHTRDDFIRLYQDAVRHTGKSTSRTLVNRQYLEGRTGVRGERVAFSYRTDFELDKGLEELIFVELENDGRWRVVSYANQKSGRPLGDPFAPPLNPGKSDRELILGTWRTVEVELGGDAIPKEVIATVDPTLTLTFSGDKVLVKPQGTFPKAFLDMAISKGLLPKDAATIVEKGTEGGYRASRAGPAPGCSWPRPRTGTQVPLGSRDLRKRSTSPSSPTGSRNDGGYCGLRTSILRLFGVVSQRGRGEDHR